MRKFTKIFTHKLSIVSAVFTLLPSIHSEAVELFVIPEPMLQQVQAQYGKDAETRLRDWQRLVNLGRSKQELEKLEMTNNFINQVKFVSNPGYQNEVDFRIAPMEFLMQGSGDSEDFAIAKYITLRKMGIASKKLRLTYTETPAEHGPQMILTYYYSPGSEPLIMDHLKKPISSASIRSDISPLYSYQPKDIWLIHSAIKMQLDLTLEADSKNRQSTSVTELLPDSSSFHY